MIGALLNRLRADRRGAAAVEFAIIAPTLMVVMTGLGDFAHASYVKSVLQGAVHKAARDGTLETASTNLGAIDQKVRNLVYPTINNATFSFERTAYSTFSNVGRPEPFTDSNGNGVRNAGECYQDYNNNNGWDADMGRSGGGGARDIVLYTVKVTYPRIMPIYGLLGWSQYNTVEATTALKNQPYGTQNTSAPVRCT